MGGGEGEGPGRGGAAGPRCAGTEPFEGCEAGSALQRLAGRCCFAGLGRRSGAVEALRPGGGGAAGRRAAGRLARCRRRLRRWLPAFLALSCWAPHAMFSVLSYGRLVARAVLGGLSQTDSRDYSLVTASCGFGKDFRKGILKKGMCYGDDACFVARHRTADVLGK